MVNGQGSSATNVIQKKLPGDHKTEGVLWGYPPQSRGVPSCAESTPRRAVLDTTPPGSELQGLDPSDRAPDETICDDSFISRRTQVDD